MPITAPQAAEREFSFTPEDFKFLATLANSKTGIVLAAQKKDMIYGRLARRLRALGLESFAEYCALLQSPEGADEIGQLINAITTNLTSFFRESHHFDHLRDHALHSMQGNRLRIWSAGCSAGMEPYSIAMTACAAIPDIARRDVRILASDIDSNMIATGAAGQYSAHDLEPLPASYRHYATRDAKWSLPKRLPPKPLLKSLKKRRRKARNEPQPRHPGACRDLPPVRLSPIGVEIRTSPG